MLAIKIPSENASLDTKGVTISYTLRSPIFHREDDGNFIFNFTIPDSDPNKKLLNFPFRIESFSNNEMSEVPVEIYFKGIHVWSGILLAKYARIGEIEVSIGMGKGEFNYESADKNLSDVVPDEEHVVGHIELKTDLASGIPHYLHAIDGFDDVVNKVYPEINFAMFPAKVDDMIASLGNAFNNAYYNTTPCLNFWDMETQKFAAPTLMGNFFPQISGINVPETNTNIITFLLAYNIFTPFPYNSWVFNNLFRNLGYFMENNPFETDEDLKRLVLFNVQTINKLWEEYAHWAGSGVDNQGNPNPNTDRYLYALEPNLSFNLKDHLPDITVKDYLKAMEDLLFFRAFINNKNKRVKVRFLKDVVSDTYYADITDRVHEIRERKLDFERISALVQQSDGADSNSGNLKAKSEIEALERIPDVWFKGNLPINDLGQYVNKICYAKMEKQFYVCQPYADDFNHKSEWVEFTFEYFLQKYIHDTGKEWTTAASGILASYFFDFRPGTSFQKYEWFIPYAKMPMKFYNSFKTKDNTCGLRLMFYRGIQDGKVQQYNVVDYVVINQGSVDDCKDYIHNLMFQHIDPYSGLSGPTSLLSNSEVDAIIASISTNGTTPAMLVAIFQNYIDTLGDARDPAGYSLSAIAIVNYIVANYCTIVIENTNVISSIEIKKYPLGTNDVYNAFGYKIPEANLSLRWDGEYGIYEKYAKTYVRWFNEEANPITMVFQPTVEDLFMDFSEKKRINGINYLIDEIRGEIKDDIIMPAEADAWSC